MERGERSNGGGGGGRFFQRRKPCRFCVDKAPIDFKDIVPRRISGNCLQHQRVLTVAVKRAREIALVSFAEER